MRRSDREIKDFDEIIEVINKCDVCRLAINDGDYPYIVPMNFGLNIEDGKDGAVQWKKEVGLPLWQNWSVL